MRILKLITLLFISLTLFGCTSINSSIENEAKRIINEIPSEFTSDLTLPKTNNNYEVKYFLNDIYLENNILPFNILPESTELTVAFTLSQEDTTKDYEFKITQVGDETLYQEHILQTEYNNIIETLDYTMSTLQTKDIILPNLDTENYTVTYRLQKGKISDSRIIYPFNDTRTTNTLTVIIRSEQETLYKAYDFTVAAIQELPNIPRIDINTVYASLIDSKYYYTRAKLSLTDESNQSNDITEVPISIRLRGNSTLWTPKKSYKIKFDEKTKLLSSYKEKDWVLLANYMDQTLVRNDVAFYLSSQLSLEFTPSHTHVDVYVNNEYQGNYILTDQIEVTNDRVDIEENTTNTDTGFLIEYDMGLFRDPNQDENYFIVDDIPFVIKSPNIDDTHYQDEQKEFITNYMEQLIRTLKNKQNYSYLIDEASFIDWYIVNEIFKNVDSGYSSVYYYKDANGLLKMGPVWDFDLSSGQYGHLGEDHRGPTGIYTALPYKNKIIYYLMQYPEFKEHVKNRYNEIYEDILLPLPDMVYTFSTQFTLSRYNNFQKWDIIGIDNEWYTSPEIYELDTYDEQLIFLHDFLDERIKWLYQEFNTH